MNFFWIIYFSLKISLFFLSNSFVLFDNEFFFL